MAPDLRGLFSLILVILLLSGFAFADELVVNGGFENGNLTGWTLSGNAQLCSDPSYNPAIGCLDIADFNLHSGSNSLEAGPIGGLGFISQNLTTVPGETYNLTFWLANDPGGYQGCCPNEFQVSWNGNTIFDGVNLPNMQYSQYQFELQATSGNTPLQFGFMQNPHFFYLDDVSLRQLPEPGSLLLVAGGLAGLLARKFCRRE